MSERQRTWVLSAATSDGEFLAEYSNSGLCGLRFPGNHRTRPHAAELAETPATIKAWHRTTEHALLAALAGEPLQELPPLDMAAGTEFQQRVWQALRQIACGRTSSYAQVAQAIGRPKAVRAVGAACGANPIPVFVPCHRVVAGHGLGGFSSGLNWKRKLLAREGVVLGKSFCL